MKFFLMVGSVSLLHFSDSFLRASFYVLDKFAHDNSSWLSALQLIRRRYFSEDLPLPSPWSMSPVPKPAQRLDDNLSDEDPFYRSTRLSFGFDGCIVVLHWCLPVVFLANITVQKTTKNIFSTF